VLGIGEQAVVPVREHEDIDRRRFVIARFGKDERLLLFLGQGWHGRCRGKQHRYGNGPLNSAAHAPTSPHLARRLCLSC
jgi:hypothetical protein